MCTTIGKVLAIIYVVCKKHPINISTYRLLVSIISTGAYTYPYTM